jgi:hypothetical protein
VKNNATSITPDPITEKTMTVANLGIKEYMVFTVAVALSALACKTQQPTSAITAAQAPLDSKPLPKAVPRNTLELLKFLRTNSRQTLPSLCETLRCKNDGPSALLPELGGHRLYSSKDPCGLPVTTLDLASEPMFSVNALIDAWGKPAEFHPEMKAPIGRYRFEAERLDVIFFSEVGVNSLRFENNCPAKSQ